MLWLSVGDWDRIEMLSFFEGRVDALRFDFVLSVSFPRRGNPGIFVTVCLAGLRFKVPNGCHDLTLNKLSIPPRLLPLVASCGEKSRSPFAPLYQSSTLPDPSSRTEDCLRSGMWRADRHSCRGVKTRICFNSGVCSTFS